MRRIPTAKTLLQIVDKKDDAATQWEKAKRCRKVLEGKGEYSGLRRNEKLAEVDTIVGNHGIEWLTFECQRERWDDPDGFSYSNTGDTYAPTLVLYNGRFRVSAWGDMVEVHERRCAACRKRLARDE